MDRVFTRIASAIASAAGKPLAFITAVLIIAVWGFSGPLFQWSDTWQLVINTGTTIVTFLMVFLIQRAQNKDSKAVHLKLNELVASIKGPSNRLIDIEESSEAELALLAEYYTKLAELAKRDKDLAQSHSIEEAKELHESKSDDEERPHSTDKVEH